MCGINGFNFQDENLIKTMNEKLKHRGPDDDGFFVDEKISLGHTRLSIIDLSDKGHQPMFFDNKNLVLVYNGEIYNFEELKKDLQNKGYKFQSQTDSEVILALYQEYGEKCVEYLNGIFAFAIWDKNKGTLFIGRDRIGVKPLYYFYDKGKLLFSSEIKSILEHDIPKKLNLEALNIYLRMLYVPAPLTMFEGIKKLEPGSCLIFKDKKLTIKKYWQPSKFTNLSSQEDAKQNIRSLMKESVNMQLISDRPVGVFLSGGIDSSIITGLVTENTKNKVKTFSAAYDVNPDKFNADAKLAQKTAKYFDTDHKEIYITGKDALDNLESVVYHMDEPVANATQISTYLLAKETVKDVTVVLGGDGGDELFGGYERYRLSKLISDYQKLPKVIKSTAKPLLSFFAKYKTSLHKFELEPGVERYLTFMAQKEKNVARFLKKNKNNLNITSDFYNNQYFAKLDKDFEKNFMWADVRSWLPDESLLRSDKMTMAHGLEQRVPILDHRLVELSLQIPTDWKIDGKNTKAIFKEALQDYIPEYLFNQPKRGWFSPTSAWLRRELKNLAYEVLSPDYNIETKEIFDFVEIKKMLDDHIEMRAYHMNLLWALIVFQIWFKKFKVSLN